MQKWIDRDKDLQHLRLLLSEFPVVALLGARQVGKTLLASQLAKRHHEPVSWYDLEDPADLSRLQDPGLELRPLHGLVVLDEVHRLPNIFALLRVLADRAEAPARFLVLGSASPALLRQTSETLAGRVAFHHLDGFSLEEVRDLDSLWLRGGFPRSFIAASESASNRWRTNFIDTFLARDLPSFNTGISTTTLRRFWNMLAHWHGQIWNGAEFGRAFGVSHTTIKRYLDLLTSLFVVRQLAPWFENISKRQVRSPKVYIADSGILHTLLGLQGREDLLSHPKVGASWEGFMIHQIAAAMSPRADQCYHWATHSGASLDLLVVSGKHRHGFEIKRTESPRLTASMRSAVATLNLDRLDVIHAGQGRFQLAPKVRAMCVQEAIEELAEVRK